MMLSTKDSVQTFVFSTDRGAGTEEVEVLRISCDETGVIHLEVSEELHQAARDFWYIMEGVAKSKRKIEWMETPR